MFPSGSSSNNIMYRANTFSQFKAELIIQIPVTEWGGVRLFILLVEYIKLRLKGDGKVDNVWWHELTDSLYPGSHKTLIVWGNTSANSFRWHILWSALLDRTEWTVSVAKWHEGHFLPFPDSQIAITSKIVLYTQLSIAEDAMIDYISNSEYL